MGKKFSVSTALACSYLVQTRSDNIWNS